MSNHGEDPEDGRARVMRSRRRLLVATIGLAATSVIGSSCTTGNLSFDSGPYVPPEDANESDAGTER